MRNVLVAWLERHGLPGWLAPDYMMMVGLAALLGAAVTMWLSERDGADTRVERRALLATYVGALLGGYVFEWLRVLPEALMKQSIDPLFHVGRAAYGGLLIGTLCAVVVLRRGRAPVLPYMDRTVPLCGISYGFVRVGCFLAGCDYGKPTASALGVRFPMGTPAAVDHAAHGWIARGGESLPVHATQLYEAAIGVLAAAIASIWLVKGKRDGRAFATFVVLYAIGRFFVEMLRGDGSRGTYAEVSTAQWVSIGLVVLVAAMVWHAKRGRRHALTTAAAALLIGVFPGAAMAQTKATGGPATTPSTTPTSKAPAASPPAAGFTPAPSSSATTVPPPPPVPGAQPYPQPAPGQPYPPQGAQPYPYPYPPPGAQPYPYPYPTGAQQPYPYAYPYPTGAQPPPAAAQTPKEPEKPKEDYQKMLNTRRLGIGLSFGGYIVTRFGVSNGGTIDIDGTYRWPTSERARFELGLGGTFITTTDATLAGVAIPFRFVGGVNRVTELEVGMAPFYSRLNFDTPYFEAIDLFGTRLSMSIGWTLGTHFQLGISPIVVGLMGGPDVKALFSYEPKFWMRAAIL
ncbi:MAG TPA: prolipoprotein diacylglyceryl transferase [Polyangium sp.]|nr:prolipoprotein diacylglyceryl transferase [Polyangium sp.]